MRKIRIGTRGSALAMWQANFVRAALERQHPALEVCLEVIRTTGDRDQQTPLNAPGGATAFGQQGRLRRLGGAGLFTREIERALLAGSVDLAVHSLKDLPTTSAEGLALAAIMAREDPADALIAAGGLTLARLPRGAKVMTGSPRRGAQLLHRRPDLLIRPVRGNVPTRVRKFDESDADAIVLARAGLVRLELAGRITERLAPAEFLPACGQGALAVQVRADDGPQGRGPLLALCGPLDDSESRRATCAERAFLAVLGGGCRVPVGAYARFTGGPAELTIAGMVASEDGSRLVERTVSGEAASPEDAAELGRRLGEAVSAAGGAAILEEVMGEPPQATEGSE